MILLRWDVMRLSRHGLARAAAQRQQKHKKDHHKKPHEINHNEFALAWLAAKRLCWINSAHQVGCAACLLAWACKFCAALSSHNCKLSRRSWRLKEQLSSVKSALDSSRLSNCIKTSSKRSGNAFRSACWFWSEAEKALVSRLSARNCARAVCSCWHCVRARSISGFGRFAGTAE